jgi:hypothetical protein
LKKQLNHSEVKVKNILQEYESIGKYAKNMENNYKMKHLTQKARIEELEKEIRQMKLNTGKKSAPSQVIAGEENRPSTPTKKMTAE